MYNNNIYNNPYNSNGNNMNYSYETKLNNPIENNNRKSKFSFKSILLFILIIIFLILAFMIARNLLKSYTMTINLNGADEIKDKEIKCKSNIKGKCFITLPEVKRTNGEVIGYSNDQNAKEAKYKIGDTFEMTSDMNLYVISKKINTLNIDKSDINEVREENISCEVYNNSSSCEVNVPMFNKLGYKIDGYTKDKNNKNDLITMGSKLTLNDSINLYPVYDEYPNYINPGKTHFNVEKSVYIYNSYLDIGQGCDSTIANSLVNDLKKLYEIYPFYAYYSKLSILNKNEYNNFSVTAGFGSSEGFTDELVYSNPTVIVKCANNLSAFLVAIHELTHALDIRNKNLTGHYINEDQELINLRNKYFNEPNRPLRNYAYSDGTTSVPEFFAELITYYYINHVDKNYKITDIAYQRGNYPDDMKKVAEKYLCIFKNNYDRTKCE